tara:strand:+ start:920 stop:1402 length:483 start_codon:yes stop_codon:yes gene_type:complete
MEFNNRYRPSSYKDVVYFDKDVQQFLNTMAQLHRVSEHEYELFRIVTYSAGQTSIVSLRAQYEENLISYQIIDNFKSIGLELNLSSLPIQKSSEPLSYEEIIGMINNTNYEDDKDGLYLSTCRVLLEEGIDIEEVKKFMNISSIYYPKLNHIFKEQISLI